MNIKIIKAKIYYFNIKNYNININNLNNPNNSNSPNNPKIKN